MIEIPLSSNPEQKFSININRVTYDVRVILNSRTSIWSISIYLEEITLVSGVPLLGGIDIFKQYNIPISNAYVVNLNNFNLDPTKENLGNTSKLFILTDEEIENAQTV